jgi:hypothetical protein
MPVCSLTFDLIPSDPIFPLFLIDWSPVWFFNDPLMKLFYLLLVLIMAMTLVQGDDVVRERPQEWKKLVPGGQFKDLFLPMPVRGGLTSDTWGGDNVKPRDVLNGIEEPEWSYWCGFPIQDDDGVYHLYTARWPEDHPRGHFGYFDSIIVHATADDPFGPYTYQTPSVRGIIRNSIRPRKVNTSSTPPMAVFIIPTI